MENSSQRGLGFRHFANRMQGLVEFNFLRCDGERNHMRQASLRVFLSAGGDCGNRQVQHGHCPIGNLFTQRRLENRGGRIVVPCEAW